MADAKSWLARYSGESVSELIALESTHHLGSRVCVFEEAIQQASFQRTNRGETPFLNKVERTVLGVEAIEREVNNGGYKQFFQNSSCEFASTIVEDLRGADCTETAVLMQAAIDALGTTNLSQESIQRIINADDEARDRILDDCDQAYYKNGEIIEQRLFEYIKANQSEIRL